MADAAAAAPGNAGQPGHSAKAWIIFAVLLIAVAVLIFFVGWLPRHRQEQRAAQEAHQEATAKPRIRVYRVERAPAVSELRLPGTTLAYTEAYIYARASGYVSKRLADIGDHVQKGQLLALIDAPDLDRQVSQARATLLQSESNLTQTQAQLRLNALNWDRYKVLVTKGVLSRQQGDQQEANYRVAEANVQQAESTISANRESLNRLIILQGYEHVTAPFSGVITSRNVDVGSLINAQGGGLGASSATPGSTGSGAQGNNQGSSGTSSSQTQPSTGSSQGGEMFTMADTSKLRVLVSVPEAYSHAIRVGGRAQMFFQEVGDQPVEGRVSRTSGEIDQNTRTLLVEVLVPNPANRFLPGMYTVVNFVDVQSARPLLIPGESIVVRDAKQMVALVRNNAVHFQPVVIGRDYGDQSEILSGLQQNDLIAQTVSDEVQEGAQVDPQYPKSDSQASGGGQSDRSGQTVGQSGNKSLPATREKASGQKGGKSGGDQSGGHKQ